MPPKFPVDSVPGQLDEIKRRLDEGDRRMGAIEFSVAENTVITRQVQTVTDEIRDAVTAGRVVTKVVKWVGALAIACSAIYAVIYQLTHGGRLPHQ